MMLKKGAYETETHNRYSDFSRPNLIAGASDPTAAESGSAVERHANLAVEDDSSARGGNCMR
jgi:hypothetical protein